MTPGPVARTVEQAMVATLKPHPRNYREHPDDQLAHLIASIKEHGFYRNVVIARDNTILAGHGVVQAARKMGVAEIPVIRLDLDPTDERALKLLVGDNEMARLTMNDDRNLTEILKEINAWGDGALLGTGFDEQMLAGLAFVTRPMHEIADKNEAAEWLGMPEFDSGINAPFKCVVSFQDAAARAAFAALLGARFSDETRTVSIWYPLRERDDQTAVRFEG